MTDRSVEGLVLAIGALLFAIGAANPVLIRAWTSPRELYLQIVAGHPTAWRLSNVLFLAGTVLTAAGMAELPMAVRVDTEGARVLTSIAGLVVAIGAVLWIVSLIGRLAVTTHVASAFVAGTGEATPVPAERLMGGLFGAFILLAGLGLVALGVGFIVAPVLPTLGWVSIAFGVVITGGYLVFGDLPPFVVYLATGLLGLALLVGWR
jgi:hypothetical protein